MPIDDRSELRRRYREPHPLVVRKQIDRVDETAARFVAASPFVVLATCGGSGADASPRGGPPGFVRVLDERRLAWGDLAGNNRIDSFQNLVENPEIGLLFLVPGREDTLRVNGRAALTDDPEVLAATTIDGRAPRLAVVVEVAECYLHCGKAVRRAGLWQPEAWPDPDDVPTAGEIFVAHLDLDATPEVVDADLEAGYRATLWEPGGGS